MSKMNDADIAFYKKKFGDRAPLLEDDLDFRLYDIWVSSREGNGFSVGINSNIVFEYAKEFKTNKLELLKFVQQIEGEYNVLKDRKGGKS